MNDRQEPDVSQRRWATKEQVAEHIGVHINTITRWVADGRIRAYRCGPRLVRFDLAEIDAMLTGADQEGAH